MITLKKDDVVMEVATELQASVFLRHGYKIVEAAPVVEAAPAAEEVPAEKPAEQKPKRGRRALRQSE